MRRSEVRHSSVISSRSRRRRLAVLRRGQPRIVESREEDGAAPEGDEGRPASRLGRMGGEDRADRQPTDERVELGIRPAEPAQPGHRIRHRILEDAVARRALAPAQGADPAARLGQVDQPEIERERPDDRLGGAEVEGAQLVVESGALERVVVAAQRDRPAPDPLDRGEQLGARLLRDDLAEQGAQQPDLGRQRVAGPGRPDPERFGRDRGRGPSAARPRHALMRPAHAAPGAPAPADRSARPSHHRTATFPAATFP